MRRKLGEGGGFLERRRNQEGEERGPRPVLLPYTTYVKEEPAPPMWASQVKSFNWTHTSAVQSSVPCNLLQCSRIQIARLQIRVQHLSFFNQPKRLAISRKIDLKCLLKQYFQINFLKVLNCMTLISKTKTCCNFKKNLYEMLSVAIFS